MKQGIKLGDKVEVLHGAYRGKTGTIVGMMVLDQDYTGPITRSTWTARWKNGTSAAKR